MIDELVEILEKETPETFAEINENLFDRIRKRLEELEDELRDADEYKAITIEEEIRTLKNLRNKLFERRVRKLIKLATAKVFGIELDIKGLVTQREMDFYVKLVELLENFKKEMIG